MRRTLRELGISSDTFVAAVLVAGPVLAAVVAVVVLLLIG